MTPLKVKKYITMITQNQANVNTMVKNYVNILWSWFYPVKLS